MSTVKEKATVGSRVKKVLGVRDRSRSRELKAAPGQAIEMPEQGALGSGNSRCEPIHRGALRTFARTARKPRSGRVEVVLRSEAGAAVWGAHHAVIQTPARPWFSL